MKILQLFIWFIFWVIYTLSSLAIGVAAVLYSVLYVPEMIYMEIGNLHNFIVLMICIGAFLFSATHINKSRLRFKNKFKRPNNVIQSNLMPKKLKRQVLIKVAGIR